MWFDREIYFGHGSLIDGNPGSLPRVVTSRSQDKQNTDSRLMSKREVKIATVEMAISALMSVKLADTKEGNEQDGAKLREFLSSLFSD